MQQNRINGFGGVIHILNLMQILIQMLMQKSKAILSQDLNFLLAIIGLEGREVLLKSRDIWV